MATSGIRILSVDPDACPSDIVGRFRSGTQVNSRPLALDEWRVTTGDPEVADAIIAHFGSKNTDGAQTWATENEDNLEVFTTSTSVDVILDGPSAVQTAMALWGRNGLIHKCDGETITSGDQSGQPCPQAGKTVAERMDAAKAGYGCAPSIQVYFRLAAEADLGRFSFSSGSWIVAGEIDGAAKALAAIDGPTLGTLALEVVDYHTAAGRHVRYTKPVLTITGPI
jgi:hypothetical protein